MLRTTAALGVCTALGCLPAGEPPPGRQIVRDRTVTYTFFSSSESNAVPARLFCTGPDRAVPYTYSGSDSTASLPLTDLYALPYSSETKEPSSLSSLEPVVQNLQPLSFGVVGSSPVTDHSGRLFISTLRESATSPTQTSPFTPGPFETTRYDPRTGERLAGMTGHPIFSPSGERMFLTDFSAGTLFEQESSLALEDARQPIFIGEDFYFVAAFPPTPYGLGPGPSPTSWTLTRIRPNATAEPLLVSSSFLSFTAVDTDLGPRLMMNQGITPGSLTAPSMLDVDTLNTTPLPSDLKNAYLVSASSNGHWLLFQVSTPPTNMMGPPLQTMTLVDWTTGARMDVDSEVVGPMGVGADRSEWRPGRDELWLQTEKGAFKLTEPGDVLTPVAVASGLQLSRAQQVSTDRSSFFTADGRYYFARHTSYEGPVYVGRVDDPTLPLVRMTPDGSQGGLYWDLGDDRLLATAWGDEDSRQDLYLVDLAAGASRPLAGSGQVVVAGRTRVLAVLDWDGARDTGALTVIDLASGAKTLLADDVYKVAIDSAPFVGHSATGSASADALAPGRRVAFLSRGRLPSPYDGLWVTELP